jgi:hypothetical protein
MLDANIFSLGLICQLLLNKFEIVVVHKVKNVRIVVKIAGGNYLNII